MQFARRTSATLAVAAFVPLLLLGILQIGSTLRQMQREAEERSLSRSFVYLARVDGELKGDFGALSVLASTQSIRNRAWEEARNRAVGVAERRPHWRNIVLTDVVASEEIWETAALTTGPTPAREDVLAFGRSNAPTAVGDFDALFSHCDCIALHQRLVIDGSPYVLTVERDLTDFQAFLLETITAGEVAALVDGQSLFLARTVDYESRRGTPATEYVRAAVARGGDGVYSGRTYEGLQNRTAYSTSHLSAWSAHIAVPATSYNLLTAGYLTFTMLAIAAALLFAAGVTWFGVRDIVARRRAEAMRLQSQKLEAMGRLAGTVAHDFNNLLSVMIAGLRLLGKSEEPARRNAILEEGLAAADRGAQLVNQLLAFSRNKPLELNCVDLKSTIDGIRQILARSLGNGVALNVNVSPRARYAWTNATQLELVLLNLAINARDAMPKGGSFTITTKSAKVRGCVDLLVRDTGIGMSEDVAVRVFEPFFTTKAPGEGTGLGLAQVHLLAKESAGSISLDTAPGKGALFTLRLRACQPT